MCHLHIKYKFVSCCKIFFCQIFMYFSRHSTHLNKLINHLPSLFILSLINKLTAIRIPVNISYLSLYNNFKNKVTYSNNPNLHQLIITMSFRYSCSNHYSVIIIAIIIWIINHISSRHSTSLSSRCNLGF